MRTYTDVPLQSFVKERWSRRGLTGTEGACWNSLAYFPARSRDNEEGILAPSSGWCHGRRAALGARDACA